MECLAPHFVPIRLWSKPVDGRYLPPVSPLVPLTLACIHIINLLKEQQRKHMLFYRYTLWSAFNDLKFRVLSWQFLASQGPKDLTVSSCPQPIHSLLPASQHPTPQLLGIPCPVSPDVAEMCQSYPGA